MRVVKRDGSVEKFQPDKIVRAMLMAYNSVRPHSIPTITANDIVVYDLIPIEEIQDKIEQKLMKSDPDVAKAFILYREERNKARAIRQKPDPDAIANYIHLSKYARYLPEKQRRETFDETVTRVESMLGMKLPLVRSKKVMPSMRCMQFAGKAIRAHHAKMYNCTYTLLDRERAFAEIFYLLLCGCGCGFSVQHEHVAKIPAIGYMSKEVFHYNIPDSIVGWAESVNNLIKAAIKGYWVEFDYSKIRREGEPLKTSGGKAPGHLPLRHMLERVRQILLNAQGRKLRSIECYDIVCHIAEAVLSGGIRRSSLICIFSLDDGEMLYAKSRENFQYDGKNAHRAMANSSVALIEPTWEQFKRVMDLNLQCHGDPGYVFLESPDHGVNPCGEIKLYPKIDGETGFAFCNLTEVNAAACTETEFYDACLCAAEVATIQATFTSFPYLGKTTEKIADHDRNIGVSITGIMDNPDCLSWMEHGREIVRSTNRTVAKILGINASARCTTVKPSGTSSLELGCVGSGIHPHHSRRYFRRITANPNEPVAQYFKSVNPHMVEEKPNGDWCLVFPVEAKGITLDDVSGMQFLKYIEMVYDRWAEHNVSATLVYKKEEWDDIVVEIWKRKIPALSFLEDFSDAKIPFVPREKVRDEGKWNYLIANYKKVDYTKMIETEDGTDLKGEISCAGGQCSLME